MKAAFIATTRDMVELRDVAIPTIYDGELLVRMKACGVCGTDLEKVYSKPITKPVLGHEVVGVVEKSKTRIFSTGDRVFVHHHVSCGTCYYCLNSSPTMCKLFSETNIEPCGFAEFFRVPAANVERGAVLRVPDWVTDDEATFIEPAACVLRALERCGFRHGVSAAIIGTGSSGAMFIRLLKAFGASFVAAADIEPFRVKYARKIGADLVLNPLEVNFGSECKKATDGRGVDLAVLATPSLKALPTALEAVRKGGTVSLFGVPEKGAGAELDFSSIFIHEINFVATYSTTEKHTNLSLALVSSGRVSYSDLVTHRFRLAKISEAFETAADPSNVLKTIVYP